MDELIRQKISRALKGRRPKNLDYLHSLPFTEERKRKIGLAHLGMKHTAETKIKCGLANKGKKYTAEHRKKMSENHTRYWLGKKRPNMTGKKNWNYGKFGSQHTRYTENKKSTLQKAIRNSETYRRYKRQVLERDRFSCVICGTNKAYLELDHYPVSFSDLLTKNKIISIDNALACQELWDLKNGRTLCQKCHETTDSFPKQLIGKRQYKKQGSKVTD